MSEDAPVNTGAVGVAEYALGILRDTEDADQIAPVGGRRCLPPVKHGAVFTGASSVPVTRYRY